MTLLTEDGIEMFVLPSVARCKCANERIEDMPDCPIKNFDDTGDICIPDLCEYYTEEVESY